jgi:hypothetical protein
MGLNLFSKQEKAAQSNCPWAPPSVGLIAVKPSKVKQIRAVLDG